MGIQDYLDRFFVGYHTATSLLSIEMIAERQALVRVDFTGDFGHEIGLLDLTVDDVGLIIHVVADLE